MCLWNPLIGFFKELTNLPISYNDIFDTAKYAYYYYCGTFLNSLDIFLNLPDKEVGTFKVINQNHFCT